MAIDQRLNVTISVLVARRPVAMMAFGIAGPVEVRVPWIYHALAIGRNVSALTIGIPGRSICAVMVLIMVPTPLIPMMFVRMVVFVRMMIVRVWMMVVLVGRRAHRHGHTQPDHQGETP